MKTRIFIMMGLMLVVGFLTLACAPRTTSPTTVDMRHETWWGIGPRLFPGLPTGHAAQLVTPLPNGSSCSTCGSFDPAHRAAPDWPDIDRNDAREEKSI